MTNTQQRTLATKIEGYALAVINNAVNNISESDKKLLKSKLEAEAKRLIIKRTQDGYDMRGVRFAPVTYNKKEAYKRVKNKGKYSSSSRSDNIQLSGYTFRNLKVELTKLSMTFQGLNVQFDFSSKTKKGNKIIEGLANSVGRSHKTTYRKPKREFNGLATAGTYKKLENEALTKIVYDFFKKKGLLI